VEHNKRQHGDKITGYRGLFLEFVQKPRQTQQEQNSQLVTKFSLDGPRKSRKRNGSPRAGTKLSYTSKKGRGVCCR
jgi:hypothetical protein